MASGTLEPQRVDVADPGYRELVRQLDAYLAVTDGADHDFYHRYNGSYSLDVVLLVRDAAGEPLACGALRYLYAERAEVKRMFVAPPARGRGLGTRVLRALEEGARSDGRRELILEPGVRQTEAVRLYERAGYRRIANYPPYERMPESLCFARRVPFGP